MSHYLFPVGMAFLVFPLIAILFTIPYVLYQYRKYGSILFFKTAIVYSFILYLLVVYFLVILPLPPIEEVAKLNTPSLQLIPFTFVSNFLEKSGFIWNQLSTYITALKSPEFYNVIFNIFLTIPFGIYLRYYFGLSKWKTILISFLLSLFFELTQLSSLYGLYPRPYRLFDVDDLITNTLGGCIGAVMDPFIAYILPSMNDIKEAAYQKGIRVSYFRRFVAFGIDGMALMILCLFVPLYESYIQYGISILLYFVVIPYVTGGRTLGKWIVQIKLVTTNEQKPELYQLMIRYGFLYLIFFPAPLYSLSIVSILSHMTFPSSITFVCVAGGIAILYAICYFQGFIAFITRKPWLYEKISNTKHISTIPIEKKSKSTSR